MSKKTFKSQASSSRAVFGNSAGALVGTIPFGRTPGSALSFVYEPPDLTSISDPSVGVSFKNLQKKDSTTKAKALEELLAYVISLQENKDGLEDTFLEAWTKLFPRTAIDNSRRVRQLSYTLQGKIAILCGKRFIKYLPGTVGAWLAGAHDGDKSVARSAQEAFTQTFATEEKRRGVWKAFHTPILEYCIATISKETPQTLSDERTSSPDDAEAKYSRAVGGALLTIVEALRALPLEDLSKHSDSYSECLQSEAVWNLASSKDVFLRKSVFHLLISAIEISKNLIDVQVVGNAMLKALDADQIGSAGDLVKSLTRLTKEVPEVWTSLYRGSSKKPPNKRLSHFLRKGSQGGTSGFWQALRDLLLLIPQEVIQPSQVSENVEGSSGKPISSILDSLREGITRKNEIRTQQTEAWRAYLQIADRIMNNIPEAPMRQQIVDQSVMPLLHHYIIPNQESTVWGTSWQEQAVIATEAALLSLKSSEVSISSELESISKSLIEDMQTSLPEQSKDFTKSQDAIITKFGRYYSLIKNLYSTDNITIRSLLSSTLSSEIEAAINLLVNRNGKPYSAATILEIIIDKLPRFAIQDSKVDTRLKVFINKNLADLMGSPSSPSLIKFLRAYNSDGEFDDSLNIAIKRLAAVPQSYTRTNCLRILASSKWPKDPESATSLTTAILRDLEDALKGISNKWILPIAALENRQAPNEVDDQILSRMMGGLSVSKETGPALQGFNDILNHDNNQALRSFVSSPDGSTLLSKLLILSHHEDENLQRQSSKIKDSVEALLSQGSNSSQTNTTFQIVKNLITSTNDDALHVEGLVSQAESSLKNLGSEKPQPAALDLFPEPVQWTKILEPFLLNEPIDQSLAILNPLGGALHFVSATKTSGTVKPSFYDSDGRSAPLRVAIFIVKLASKMDILQNAPDERLAEFFSAIAVFSQLAGDNLSLLPTKPVYDPTSGVNETEFVDSITEIQNFSARWFKEAAEKNAAWLPLALQELSDRSEGTASLAYYHARAYAANLLELKEIQKIPSSESDRITNSLSRSRKSPHIFSDFVALTSAPQSSDLLRLFNELVSDLTSWKSSDGKPEWHQLITLNILLQTGEIELEDIPRQRLVFLVKSLVDVLGGTSDQPLKSELLKAIAVVIPILGDIYEDFWESIIEDIIFNIANEHSELPTLHASLRLCTVLRRMAKDDSNEDLQESWNKLQPKIANSLLRLLQMNADMSDTHNQPLKIIHELLSRQVSVFADSMKLETDDMYPVMASESTILQRAAFKILEKSIPASQEQVSLDAALSKDFIPELPEELLSLMLEAPRTDDILGLRSEPELPSHTARYLLSWKLIFAHWENASYKVQAAYVSSLKEGDCVPDLLSFAFSILLGQQGTKDKNGVDPSRFPSVETYNVDNAEDPWIETQWLLIHLYYLLLKHAPHLAKDWHTNSCPRAIKSKVETWTEKYFSPLIVAAELETVSQWTPPASDELNASNLEIKVSPKAREVTASLPIDETSVSIRIHLPTAYPLAPIAIATSNRVGVDEKKWTAFLNVSRIMMNFSSTSQGLGAVIDGISAWRNNVQAVLRGQTECAICYSVVSEDRKVPDKRCATCRNLFHGVCLYKWFQRSAASSCPLCRNAFNYA
jgi:E3 ubiquitin-protein ligase listerin